MSVTSESPATFADALAEVDGTATEVMGWPVRRNGLGKGKAGGGSTHIGLGDSCVQEAGWKEEGEAIAGVEPSEAGAVVTRARWKRPPVFKSGIPNLVSALGGGRERGRGGREKGRSVCPVWWSTVGLGGGEGTDEVGGVAGGSARLAVAGT